MNRRLDDESASLEQYGRNYGRRYRGASSVPLRVDARKCCREDVTRDARAYADAWMIVPVKVRREKK